MLNKLTNRLLLNTYLKTKTLNMEHSIYLFFFQESVISQNLLKTNKFKKNQTFFRLSNISQSFYRIKRKRRRKKKKTT